MGVELAVRREPAGICPTDLPHSCHLFRCHCCYCRVWSEEQRKALCNPLSAFRYPVTAITTDEHGRAWVASGAAAAVACPAPSPWVACPALNGVCGREAGGSMPSSDSSVFRND